MPAFVVSGPEMKRDAASFSRRLRIGPGKALFQPLPIGAKRRTLPSAAKRV